MKSPAEMLRRLEEYGYSLIYDDKHNDWSFFCEHDEEEEDLDNPMSILHFYNCDKIGLITNGYNRFFR